MPEGKHEREGARRFRPVWIALVCAGAVLLALLIFYSQIRVCVSLTGEPDVKVEYGDPYEDAGATASVSVPFFGDRSVPVHTKGEVRTDHVEKTDITYSAHAYGRRGKAVRHVSVVDTKAPEIALTGGAQVTVQAGSSWTDAYAASDNADGDVTDRVKVSGSADLSKPGAYPITYTVKDRSGNEASAQRTVVVIPKDTGDASGLSKVVFLTFDDGPGPYTGRLLDVLKKHSVKATFFVTGVNGNFRSMIGREKQEGHTVAVHTYSHRYARIYASDAAYWADFEQMEQIVQQQTGSRTNLFRFPGGSSNTVSRRYSSGIMSRLAAESAQKGLVYFDWNVSSGDAGSARTADAVYTNLMNGIHSHSVSVALCHDIKPGTVDAMDRFLTDAQKEGYVFLPLSEKSPTARHGISN